MSSGIFFFFFSVSRTKKKSYREERENPLSLCDILHQNPETENSEKFI